MGDAANYSTRPLTGRSDRLTGPHPLPAGPLWFDTGRRRHIDQMDRWEARGMAADSPLLEMEKVNKWFGDLHVLQDVDLEVDPGEVVVVVGPSGSGKSTLCRAINRLEPIDDGTIRLQGQPLPSEGRELARLRSDVGMVFQQFNLFAHRSVLDNVTLGPIKV